MSPFTPRPGPPYTVKDGVVESGVPATTEEKPFDPAAWMHQRLVNQIVAFEKNLGPDHESRRALCRRAGL